METVVKHTTSSEGPRVPRVLIVFASLWLGSIVLGGTLLLRHAYSGGSSADPARDWPVGPSLKHSTEHPTLVMLIHPGCPCSRASVEQLDRLLSKRGDQLRAVAIFLGEPKSMSGSRSFRHAERIEALQTLADPGGALTDAFGGATSGDTFLYDTDGRLLFHGGITPSRGHAGEGVGYDAIVEILDGLGATTIDVPTFGCALHDEEVIE